LFSKANLWQLPLSKKNCFNFFGNCRNPKRLIKTGTLCPPRRQQSLTNEKMFILPEIKKSEINQTEEEA